MARHTSVRTTEVFEEIGRNGQCGIEVEVTWDIQPAEPMVMYDRNGGGYPGSPATAEAVDYRVTAAWGSDWFAVRRHPQYGRVEDLRWPGQRLISAASWLDTLTGYAERLIEADCEHRTEHAFEVANEESLPCD